MWDEIAGEAARESRLWEDALRPADERCRVAVFSPLAADRYALGLETIYEGYLVHYGTSRLFSPPDADVALLLGDYLYAHGLVHVADDVAAVADLSELISLCSQLRAEQAEGDGALWAATAVHLGRDGEDAAALGAARAALRLRGDAAPLESLARGAGGDSAVDRALAAHAGRLR
jgi:hypothetical protein